MNDYDEYLLITGEKNGETKHISSNDICYVEAAGRDSIFYLNNDEELYLGISLGDFEKLIVEWFPFNHKYFYRIGKSLMINRKYLDAFYVSKGKIILAETRSEYLKGYKAGYKAGYSDRDNNKTSFLPSFPHPEVKELSASEQALSDFKKKIEEKLSKRKGR